MRANEFAHRVGEDAVDEMALPADWDASKFKTGVTSFKARLAYALERAKKLGTGSSRVATIIEYQGRPTVLKIAKNKKGLAQNNVEADILSDGYASQLGILIPIIDYDKENQEPTWIQTEMAQKATEKQLCSIMKCRNLWELIGLAEAISGPRQSRFRNSTPQELMQDLRERGESEEDIQTMVEYANTLAELANSFNLVLADFSRKANWGLYQGRPVIIDVGFTSNVMQQYYIRK